MAKLIGPRGTAIVTPRKGAEIDRLNGALERPEEEIRAETEWERRRTLDRYAALLNSIDGIVWEADSCTFHFDFVSKRAEGILGYPTSRWIDEPTFWADHVHPDDRAWCLNFCEQATGAMRDHVMEYRMIAADGRSVWLRDLVTVVVEDGRPVRLRGIMVDITARKQVEEERRRLVEDLDESNALLDALFRTAPIGLGYLDRSLRFTRINDELAAINGISIQAQLGRSLEEVLPSIAPQVIGHFRSVLATGHPVVGVEVNGESPASPGELRWWVASYYPIRRGDAIVGVGIVIEDITEDKRAAQALEDLAIERGRLLTEAQRALRARDVFLTVASHELKTPLTPLMLNLQHIRAALAVRPEDARLTERLDVALRQVDRLSRQVEAMLDVARDDTRAIPLLPGVTDVSVLARRVTSRLAAEAARAHCPFHLQIESPAIAEIDPARIEEVIEILVTNALRYGRGAPIAVRVWTSPGAVHIAVEDHGIGIDPEDQERIFGLFERAVSERRYGGLGLGLYIARRIVEEHGGRISCVSAPGAGSRFEVELPVVRPHRAEGKGSAR